MPEEQNLVHNKVRQTIQTFTLVSQSSNIELHDGLDMIIRPFAIPAFCIHNRDLSVINILVSQEHPDQFLPTIRVQERRFLPEHVPCKDVDTDQDENQATDYLHFVAKNIFKPLTEHHTGK